MTDTVKPAPDGVVISRELLAFLCGDGPLDGHYFGEKPEHERGNFWWRKHLRAAEQAALEQAGEPVGLREALEHCDQDNRIVLVPVDLYRQVMTALATPSQPDPQSRGQAFDGEGEELA